MKIIPFYHEKNSELFVFGVKTEHFNATSAYQLRAFQWF